MSVGDFEETCLHVDVLCISNYLKYILAGVGCRLFVYEDKTFILSKRIFEDERIHAICINGNLIALRGIRKLCVINLSSQNNDIEIKIITEVKCTDWIQDLTFLGNNLVGINTAHNCFQVWELKTGNLIEEKNCVEKCILYSCKIIGDSKNNLIVFSGTVFGEVQIWSPFFSSGVSDCIVPFHKFKGHDGAVFSIEVKPSNNIVCTTSDDRSLKIWKIICEKSIENISDWKAAKIELIQTSYTHTARVWKSLILPNFFITIGEDSKLAVWRSDGTLFKTLHLHRGGGIRALHYSKESGCILTGGEDGGINAIKWDSLISESCPKKIVDLDQNFSTKVNFINDGIVYTQNKGCAFVSNEGIETYYSNKVLENYCVMEVSSNKDFIFFGSIKGDLIVINTKTKTVLFEKKCVDGRVYSIHWLEGCVLTCGPNGEVDLWKFNVEDLVHLKKMIIPDSKERWTTCGVLFDKNLIVGDRMGNIHVFDTTLGGDPIRTYRKIHKHLGVTDAAVYRNGILSVGRDGTAKMYTDTLKHSLTYKLPMEWPWKIVSHQGDTLILGFHSVSLVVFSMKTGEIILNHDCGGGHRSCDLKLVNNILSFLYVKEKKIYRVELNLDEISRIRNGFHSKEINELKLIQRSHDHRIVITGSEDTTLRISLMKGSDLQEIAILKTHTSSIRAVGICFFTDDVCCIVSGGGKGQMVVWLFDTKTHKCEEMACLYFKESTRNWKSSTPDVDTDVRIMCIDLLASGSDSYKPKLLIVVGCSDAKIKLFTFDGEKLTLKSTFSYNCCILKVLIKNFGGNGTLVMVAGTDGNVIFLKVSDECDLVFLEKLNLHESGINCMKVIGSWGEKFLLATGGDDNKVLVSQFKLINNGLSSVNSWHDNTSHACQITGITSCMNFLITASIDQRVTVWKWWSEGSNFEIKYKNQYITCVPDVQGIDIAFDCKTVQILVHGKGIEKLESKI